MKIKEVGICSAFCWHPRDLSSTPQECNKPLLALADLAGTMGDNFNDYTHLQIRSILGNNNNNNNTRSSRFSMPIVGYCSVPEKVQKIDWSRYSVGSHPSMTGEYSNNGIIAAGIADGNVRAWDANVLLSNYSRRLQLYHEEEASREKNENRQHCSLQQQQRSGGGYDEEMTMPSYGTESKSAPDDEFGSLLLNNGCSRGMGSQNGHNVKVADGSIFFADDNEYDGIRFHDPTLCNIEAHIGNGLNCLSFNVLRSEILATAGSNDRELKIWTLEDPTVPKFVPAFSTAGDVARGALHKTEITDVQWNSKYESIIGSVTSGGTFHLFDLRMSKETHSIANSNVAAPAHPNVNQSVSLTRGSATALAWHPSGTTTVAIARTTMGQNSNATFNNRMMMGTTGSSAGGPIIQIWDLRKAVAPVVEFGLPLLMPNTQFYNALVANPTMSTGNAGNDIISGLSWSKDDKNLMLAAGNDGKVCCWNANTAELLSVPALSEGGAFISDVKWLGANDPVWGSAVKQEEHSSKETRPVLFVTSSFDNKTTVYSATDPADTRALSSAVSMSSDRVPHINSACPQWLKKTTSSFFGFGNKVVSLNSQYINALNVKCVEYITIRRAFNDNSETFAKMSASDAEFRSALGQGINDMQWIARATSYHDSECAIPEENVINVFMEATRMNSRLPLLIFLGMNIEDVTREARELITKYEIFGFCNGTVAVKKPAAPSIHDKDGSGSMPRDVSQSRHDVGFDNNSNGGCSFTQQQPLSYRMTEVDEFDFSAVPSPPRSQQQKLKEDPSLKHTIGVPRGNPSFLSDAKDSYELKPVDPHEMESEYAALYNVLARCIVLGMLNEALELCLATKNFDDAFAVATVMGAETVMKVRETFFAKGGLNEHIAYQPQIQGKQAKHLFITYLEAAATRNFSSLFEIAIARFNEKQERPAWKDALALIASFGNPQEFSNGAKSFGLALEAAINSLLNITNYDDSIGVNGSNMVDAAAICYIACVEIESVLKLWCGQLRRREVFINRSGSLESLRYSQYRVCSAMDITHTATILEIVTNKKVTCNEFSDLLARLARTLFNEAQDYTTALFYATRAAHVGSIAGAIIADRAQYVMPLQQRERMQKQPFPFQIANIPESSQDPEVQRLQQMQRWLAPGMMTTQPQGQSSQQTNYSQNQQQSRQQTTGSQEVRPSAPLQGLPTPHQQLQIQPQMQPPLTVNEQHPRRQIPISGSPMNNEMLGPLPGQFPQMNSFMSSSQGVQRDSTPSSMDKPAPSSSIMSTSSLSQQQPTWAQAYPGAANASQAQLFCPPNQSLQVPQQQPLIVTQPPVPMQQQPPHHQSSTMPSLPPVMMDGVPATVPQTRGAPQSSLNISQMPIRPVTKSKTPTQQVFALDTNVLPNQDSKAIINGIINAVNMVTEKRKRDAIERSTKELYNQLLRGSVSVELIELLIKYCNALGTPKAREIWYMMSEKYMREMQSFLHLKFL